MRRLFAVFAAILSGGLIAAAVAWACVDPNLLQADCVETVNPHGQTVPPAGSTTEPGPQGGQNEDGFYQITGVGRGTTDQPNFDPVFVIVIDFGADNVFGTADDTTFGPYPSGTVIKYTEANGTDPREERIGSDTGQAGAVEVHIFGQGDAGVQAVFFDLPPTDPQNQKRSNLVTCKVPPPPKGPVHSP